MRRRRRRATGRPGRRARSRCRWPGCRARPSRAPPRAPGRARARPRPPRCPRKCPPTCPLTSPPTCPRRSLRVPPTCPRTSLRRCPRRSPPRPPRARPARLLGLVRLGLVLADRRGRLERLFGRHLVRVVLLVGGRRGLPVTSRMAAIRSFLRFERKPSRPSSDAIAWRSASGLSSSSFFFRTVMGAAYPSARRGADRSGGLRRPRRSTSSISRASASSTFSLSITATPASAAQPARWACSARMSSKAAR